MVFNSKVWRRDQTITTNPPDPFQATSIYQSYTLTVYLYLLPTVPYRTHLPTYTYATPSLSLTLASLKVFSGCWSDLCFYRPIDDLSLKSSSPSNWWKSSCKPLLPISLWICLLTLSFRSLQLLPSFFLLFYFLWLTFKSCYCLGLS